MTLDEEATNEEAMASCQRLHISRPDEISNLVYAVSNPQAERELRHNFPNLCVGVRLLLHWTIMILYVLTRILKNCKNELTRFKQQTIVPTFYAGEFWNQSNFNLNLGMFYLKASTNPTLFAHPEELQPLVSVDSKSTRFVRLKLQRSIIRISDRAFSIYGPKLWNQLPTALKNELNFVKFKGDLKTCLFRDALYL